MGSYRTHCGGFRDIHWIFIIRIHVFHHKFLKIIKTFLLTMNSCVTVCMQTCFNSYTSFLSEMNIFSFLFIIVGIISVLIFICMFWYTFMLHDFGQNEWEEKSDRNIVYKVEKLEKLEKAHVGAAPEVKREDVTIQEDTQNILREKQNSICEVVIERPFSVRKIMFEKSKKDSLDDDKESDSGVGAESPNAVTTPENEAADEDDNDDDVQIDELFICRSKSAFSRPSIDEAVSE